MKRGALSAAPALPGASGSVLAWALAPIAGTPVRSDTLRIRRLCRQVLVGVALLAGLAAAMVVSCRTAIAACTVAAAPTNTVDCGSTTTADTTNTNATATTSSDREQLFNAGGAVSFTTATVAPGATIGGAGLAITNTQAGVGAGDITINNAGTITLTGVPSGLHGGTSALNVTANGGTITYTGSGAINSSAGTVAAAFSTGGAGAVTVTTSNDIAGTTGIQASAVGGLININVNSGTVLGTGLLVGQGISATSTGTGGITVNLANSAQIGAAGGAVAVGISAATQGAGNTAGDITVTTSAGSRITAASTIGVSAGIGATIRSAASTGNISIAANGAIISSGGAANTSFGINASTAGTGSVTVATGNDITVTNGNAIQASAINGLTTVNVNGGTVQATSGVFGTGIGVNATSTGTGGISVSLANTAQIGVAGAVSGGGIVAVTQGAGNTAGDVTVTTSAGSKIFAGNNAIDALIQSATSTGTVTVTANGLIRTSGFFDIQAATAGTGSVTVTAGGAIGGSANTGIGAAINNATNANDVTVHANGTIAANVTGVHANTFGSGNVVVDGTGSVSGGFNGIVAFQIGAGAGGVTVGGAAGIGNVVGGSFGIDAEIQATSTGNVSVTRVGDVSAGAIGIQATTPNSGNVLVQQIGTVTGGNAVGNFGINATSGTGNVTVGGTGTLAIGAVAGATGINAATAGAGAVTLTTVNDVAGTSGNAIQASATDGLITVGVNGGTVRATGSGIFARSTGTGGIAVSLANAAQISAGGTTFGGVGIAASTSGAGNTAGDVTVTTSSGSNIFAAAAGISATVNSATSTGNITVTANGAISSTGAFGINAMTAGTGSVTVTAGGAIDPPTTGINAVISNAANANDVTVHANNTLTAAVTGVNAATVGTGNVVVDGTGSGITGGTTGVNAVQSGSGTGGVTVGGATGIGNVTGINNVGIFAQVTGTSTGNVSVTNVGNVSGGTIGIQAATVNSGNVTVQRTGTVTGGNAAGNAGIDARSGTGNVTVGSGALAIGAVAGATGINAATAGAGAVTVTTVNDVAGTNGNAIQAGATNGLITVGVNGGTLRATGAGIATTSTGTGGIAASLANTAQIGTSGTPVGGVGIAAVTQGAGNTAGDIAVTTSAGSKIFATGDGIDAMIQGAPSSGNIAIMANGALGAGAYGINAATGGAGSVMVATSSNITGASQTGILTSAATGLTTVNVNAGIVQGAASAINASSAGGAIAINNGAFIQNLSGASSALAIATSGAGNATIANGGTVLGTVNMLGTGTNIFNQAGIWSTGGTSNFAGSSTLNNSGRSFIAGNATFNGLGTLNNQASGVVSMQNGSVAGSLTTTGNYVGAAGSQVAVDIRLDQNTAAQRADRLIVNGTSIGSTIVNFQTVGGAGVLFATPIPVITSSGGNIQATAANLPAASGIVNYGLQQTSPGNWAVVSKACVSCITAPLTGILSPLASIDASFHQPASAFVTSAQGTDPDKWTGGIWSRMSGGQDQIKATGTDTFAGATATAALTTQTNFFGWQSGLDTGWLNIGGAGWNGHFGVTGGEITAQAGASLGAQGSEAISFRVPFVGLYGVATNGTIFADFTVRQDFISMDATSAVAGLSNTPFGGRATNVNGTLGYHLGIGSFVIEPSAALSWTRSQFDSLTVNGNSLLAFDTMQSLLGRVGVRLADTTRLSDLMLQPFLALSLWHEFEGQATGQYINNMGSANAIMVPISVDRVGTFGQVGIGLNAALMQTGLAGYVRADARFGDRISGVGVIGGLRYNFE